MSFWLIDPELFLYVKGIDPDDVHLWKCNKPVSSSSLSSSSLIVPMESDDFDYVSKVENHVELIGDMFDWDETDYKRLVKYIYEKHLLINSQGFVIAEVLDEADKDGNKEIDDADEEEEDVHAIYYIRSLDVLPLKTYIPKLRERPIPLRTVKYLGDLNGKVAMMEADSQVTKLTARVEHLEAENIRLESKNKILEGQVTKLNIDLTTQTNKANAMDDVWMNHLTHSEWVGVEGLRVVGPYDITIVGPLGTFTTNDYSTNIPAKFWYKAKIVGVVDADYKCVSPEDLTPYKDNARFSPQNWVSIKSNGKTYVLSPLPYVP